MSNSTEGFIRAFEEIVRELMVAPVRHRKPPPASTGNWSGEKLDVKAVVARPQDARQAATDCCGHVQRRGPHSATLPFAASLFAALRLTPLAVCFCFFAVSSCIASSCICCISARRCHWREIR